MTYFLLQLKFNFIASQMWCLARYLLLLIGEHIPLKFPHWECFLQLLLITDYVFAPVMSHNDVTY